MPRVVITVIRRSQEINAEARHGVLRQPRGRATHCDFWMRAQHEEEQHASGERRDPKKSIETRAAA
jgi:hypothetical protein